MRFRAKLEHDVEAIQTGHCHELLHSARDDIPCFMTLSRVIEALLFSAQKPLSTREISAAIRSAKDDPDTGSNEFSRVREAEVAAALEELKVDYIEQQRALQLIEKAEGWRLA